MKRKWVSARGVALLLLAAVPLCFGLYFVFKKGNANPAPLATTDQKEQPIHSQAPRIQGKEPRPDLHQARSGDGQNNSEAVIVLTEPPHIAYRKFLGRAEAGDSRAQLILTEILERCRHSSIQSKESLARLEARGDMSDELLADYRGNLEQCGGLYDLLEGFDLDSLWAFWLEEAADNLPVAEIATSLVSLEAEYSDALYRQLQAGISAASGDWIQERVIRQVAFSFFRRFVESTQYDASVDDAGYYLRADDSLAWEYLHCRNSVHCDLEVFERQVFDQFYEYQVDDMRRRAKELDRAIEERNWKRLGLRIDTD
ncbi:hypothetical protein [uncultured Microbulbifer sp.]|uniref:hypothetical protein n=1 Tax=uncultured Microbulbifer sp. TaxID=348147 RepID=UPI00263888B5|nr:hypothetical protein [uncultured Microbulbifer sp.]